MWLTCDAAARFSQLLMAKIFHPFTLQRIMRCSVIHAYGWERFEAAGCVYEILFWVVQNLKA